jgi:hypothetical protein
MKRLAFLLLLIPWQASAAELAGATTAAVGQVVAIAVDGEPGFDGAKTVAENLETFYAWLASTRFQCSAPDGAAYKLDTRTVLLIESGGIVPETTLTFSGDKPGLYVVAALIPPDLALHRIEVAGGPFPPPPPPPPPPPTDAPWESPGLSVLILRESQSTGTLPVAQRAIFTDAKVHQWLTSNCVKLPPSGRPGYRIWDDDGSDVSAAPTVLQAAYKVTLAKMPNEEPTIGISNGKTGFVGPLPVNAVELLALLEKYK